jgi:metalloendopeptidase OMA1, mitochondrial
MNVRWIAAGMLMVFGVGCATVPYTNRKQLSLVSEEQENQLGLQAYADVKAKNKISNDARISEMVTRVGKRVAAAADKPSWDWQFTVIDDPKTMNAFCLPGGRIAVYTGILPVTKDEDGLAVVVAHEVAHALAHHGAERMSDQMAAGLAMNILLAGKSQEAVRLTEMAYGVTVELPHGRKQESESDHIGLILMAKAGYDPRKAVDFWQRMAASSGGNKPPEFLSTHPSDARRIDEIKAELPEALTYYHP